MPLSIDRGPIVIPAMVYEENEGKLNVNEQ
jgi:hypothetical protein